MKYKVIKLKTGLLGIIQSTYVGVFDSEIRSLEPIELHFGKESSEWTIPITYINNKGPFEKILNYIYHREDGPAKICRLNNIEWYYWYGRRAENKSQWLDSKWRRSVEIEKFL